jgi:CBS domain-containing protein
MLCKDIMNPQVEWIGGNDTVQLAAALMRDANIGFLPVCDAEAQKVLGIVTDRDIVIRVVAQNRPAGVRISEIMSPNIVYCRPDDGLERAQQLMAENHISRLLIVDDERRIAGIVSLSDIAKNASAVANETLRRVSERESPR